MASAAGAPPISDVLHAARFRLLLGAQLVAQCADGIAQAAFADAVILDPTAEGTPERILAVFALTLLPYSVLAPFLGVFVDRWDRRAVLVGTNLCRAVLLGSLPAWDDALPADLALYGALLALLAFGRLFLTTKAAVLPVLLGETHLLQGNAISGGAGMIAALVGGVLGLGAAAALGPALVFALSGALYCASAIAAYRLGRLAPARVASDEPLGEAFGRIARELRRGLLEVWERRRARVALGAIFVLRSAVMLTALAAVLIIKNEYPGAGDRVGRLSAGALALGTSSLGAFAGALFVSWFGRRFGSARLILQGFVVAGAGIVALGGIPDLRAVLILTAIAGYGAYVAKIAADAQVQEALADAYRGRAFALYDVLYNLASVTAAAVIVAFQEISFRALFVPAGGATLALTALVWAAMRRADMLGSRAP